MLTICFYICYAKWHGEQQCNKSLSSGAEANSAADGVDTAVGEATETARTGSSTKTQNRSQDPKVQVPLMYSCTLTLANSCICEIFMHDFFSQGKLGQRYLNNLADVQ